MQSVQLLNDGEMSVWSYTYLPSVPSILPSLTSILPSLAWSKPPFAHLTIIEKLCHGFSEIDFFFGFTWCLFTGPGCPGGHSSSSSLIRETETRAPPKTPRQGHPPRTCSTTDRTTERHGGLLIKVLGFPWNFENPQQFSKRYE